jgi:hypothetical protein
MDQSDKPPSWSRNAIEAWITYDNKPSNHESASSPPRSIWSGPNSPSSPGAVRDRSHSNGGSVISDNSRSENNDAHSDISYVASDTGAMSERRSSPLSWGTGDEDNDPKISPQTFQFQEESSDSQWKELINVRRAALAEASERGENVLEPVLALHDALWKYFWTYQPTPDASVIDEIIALCRKALPVLPIDGAHVARRKLCLYDLAVALCTRSRRRVTETYTADMSRDDMREAIIAQTETTDLPDGDYVARQYPFSPLALEVFSTLERAKYEEAEKREQEILHQRRAGRAPDRPIHILVFSREYRRINDMPAEESLDDIIYWHRKALPAIRSDGWDLLAHLTAFQIALWRQFWNTESMDTLHELVAVCEEAVSLLPDVPIYTKQYRHATILATCAAVHWLRNMLREDEKNSVQDQVYETLLRARKSGFNGRLAVLESEHPLALKLQLCIVETVDQMILSEPVVQEIAEKSWEDAERTLNLWFLRAGAFEQFTDEMLAFLSNDDLEASIRRCHDALEQDWPTPNDRRLLALSEASAIQLLESWERIGHSDDLKKSITQLYDALKLYPPNDSRVTYLEIKLAKACSYRHEYLEDRNALQQAKSIWRALLERLDEEDIQRSICLAGFAYCIGARYNLFGNARDLIEAEAHCRQALKLAPSGDPRRLYCLQIFTNILRHRWIAAIDPGVIKDAIAFTEEFLQICSNRYFFRGSYVRLLAYMLNSQYLLSEDLALSDRSNTILREEIERRAPASLSRGAALDLLSQCLLSRFSKTKDELVLEEAFDTAIEALECTKKDSTNRALYLVNISQLYLQDSPRKSISLAFQYLHEALQDEYRLPRLRLEDAMDLMESTEFTICVSGPLTSVEREGLLQIYGDVLSVVPVAAASVGLDAGLRLDRIRRYETMASDGAAHWILLGRPERALEILEEGRALFWQQSLRLRTRFDDLIGNDNLRDFEAPLQELARVSTWLEKLSLHKAIAPGESIEMPGGVTSGEEDMIDRRQWWTDRFYTILRQIRKTVPGYERFLLPDTYETLARCSADGPVVLLIASEVKCFAIIISGNPGTAQQVDFSEILTLGRLEDLGGAIKDEAIRVRSAASTSNSSSLHGDDGDESHRGIGVSRPQHHDKTTIYLTTLWREIMKPIVDALKLPVWILYC